MGPVGILEGDSKRKERIVEERKKNAANFQT